MNIVLTNVQRDAYIKLVEKIKRIEEELLLEYSHLTMTEERAKRIERKIIKSDEIIEYLRGKRKADQSFLPLLKMYRSTLSRAVDKRGRDDVSVEKACRVLRRMADLLELIQMIEIDLKGETNNDNRTNQ